MNLMDKDWVKESERKETLDKIIKEVGSSYYQEAFDAAVKAPYGTRTEVYQNAFRKIHNEQVLPKEQKWKKDITTILNNFEALDEYLVDGKVNSEGFNDFMNTLENHPYITQSKTLRKLFKEYKGKLENYSSENKKPKKTKKKRTRKRRTDNSEE